MIGNLADDRGELARRHLAQAVLVDIPELDEHLRPSFWIGATVACRERVCLDLGDVAARFHWLPFVENDQRRFRRGRLLRVTLRWWPLGTLYRPEDGRHWRSDGDGHRLGIVRADLDPLRLVAIGGDLCAGHRPVGDIVRHGSVPSRFRGTGRGRSSVSVTQHHLSHPDRGVCLNDLLADCHGAARLSLVAGNLSRLCRAQPCCLHAVPRLDHAEGKDCCRKRPKAGARARRRSHSS